MFLNSPAKSPESDESALYPSFELSQIIKDEMKPIGLGEPTLNISDSMVVENVRKRRSSDQGALRDIDKNEQDLVYRFAELAVRTLDEVDPDNNKRILLGVTEAKKQVSAMRMASAKLSLQDHHLHCVPVAQDGTSRR